MPFTPRVDFILFGGTGDLALRKLLPALYNRACDGDLLDSRILGVARESLTTDSYRARVREACAPFIEPERFRPEVFDAFVQRIDYVRVDANDGAPIGAANLTRDRHRRPTRSECRRSEKQSSDREQRNAHTRRYDQTHTKVPATGQKAGG